MIIMLLNSLFPYWRWEHTTTSQFTMIEIVFIDLPVIVWFSFGFVKMIGVF